MHICSALRVRVLGQNAVSTFKHECYLICEAKICEIAIVSLWLKIKAWYIKGGKKLLDSWEISLYLGDTSCLRGHAWVGRGKVYAAAASTHTSPLSSSQNHISFLFGFDIIFRQSRQVSNACHQLALLCIWVSAMRGQVTLPCHVKAWSTIWITSLKH